MDVPGWIMAAVAVIGVCGALYAWFEKRLGDEEDARLTIERDLAAYKLHHVAHTPGRPYLERMFGAEWTESFLRNAMYL